MWSHTPRGVSTAGQTYYNASVLAGLILWNELLAGLISQNCSWCSYFLCKISMVYHALVSVKSPDAAKVFAERRPLPSVDFGKDKSSQIRCGSLAILVHKEILANNLEVS